MLVAKLLGINLLFIAGFILLLPNHIWLFSICSALILTLLLMTLKAAQIQQDNIMQAMLHGLQNLQDGDFSISLIEDDKLQKNVKKHQLVSLFNQVTDKLREEKQSLFQRELLLDKVVNASDVVTVLVNHRNTIIFANRAAQQFFGNNALLGQSWLALLNQQAPELIQHLDKNEAIIQLTMSVNTQAMALKASSDVEKVEQSWHLSKHQLKLHGSNHQLTLLKPMTKELHKQELQTWKKAIRVINHELNNSIAPISSMCHSGKVLAGRIAEPQLDRVFNTIAGRINKLSEFIQNYSQLARLSSPQKHAFDLVQTLEQLKPLYPLELRLDQSQALINADESQIEQLLINLLKNAKEVSPEKPTEVCVQQMHDYLDIKIRDFGPGMSQSVMMKAFLPLFSTKAQGSGIGLSICREVVDAHQGQISLSNHVEGGLQVLIHLPTQMNN